MSAIGWIMLVVGVVLGLVAGIPIGYFVCLRRAAKNAVQASDKIQEKATVAGDEQRQAIKEQAAAAVAAVPNESPQQLIDEMEALK